MTDGDIIDLYGTEWQKMPDEPEGEQAGPTAGEWLLDYTMKTFGLNESDAKAKIKDDRARLEGRKDKPNREVNHAR